MAISQQPTYRVESDVRDIESEERGNSLSTPKQAADLFASFILDNIDSFVAIAITEESDIEFWVLLQKNMDN